MDNTTTKTDDVKYLSNIELVAEFSSKTNPSKTDESWKRRGELYEEILRRLEEPWMKLKDSITVENHKEQIKSLTKKFSDRINNINYQSSIRHQIDNIKIMLKRL